MFCIVFVVLCLYVLYNIRFPVVNPVCHLFTCDFLSQVVASQGMSHHSVLLLIFGALTNLFWFQETKAEWIWFMSLPHTVWQSSGTVSQEAPVSQHNRLKIWTNHSRSAFILLAPAPDLHHTKRHACSSLVRSDICRCVKEMEICTREILTMGPKLCHLLRTKWSWKPTHRIGRNAETLLYL